MNQAGLPKIRLQGSGTVKPPKSKQLTRDCDPGDIVHWSAIDGTRYLGELTKWDSNVATVNIGSTHLSVEC